MKIVAHRGESKAAPENTMPAFELAWERGARWIELDVHISSDGVVVVNHDYDTGRTGDKKLVIAKSTFEQLRQVDVGIKKAKRWENTRMSSLAEVISAMPRRKGFGMLIEIKSDANPAIVPAIKKVIEDSGRRCNQFVIISFFGKILSKAKRLMPELETRLLVGGERDKSGKFKPTPKQIIARVKKLGVDSVGPGWLMVDDEFIATMRLNGIKIHPWTIDHVNVARKLISMGVDSLTSNRPYWLNQKLEKIKL